MEPWQCTRAPQRHHACGTSCRALSTCYSRPDDIEKTRGRGRHQGSPKPQDERVTTVWGFALIPANFVPSIMGFIISIVYIYIYVCVCVFFFFYPYIWPYNKWVSLVFSPLYKWSYGPLPVSGDSPPTLLKLLTAGIFSMAEKFRVCSFGFWGRYPVYPDIPTNRKLLLKLLLVILVACHSL